MRRNTQCAGLTHRTRHCYRRSYRYYRTSLLHPTSIFITIQSELPSISRALFFVLCFAVSPGHPWTNTPDESNTLTHFYPFRTQSDILPRLEFIVLYALIRNSFSKSSVLWPLFWYKCITMVFFVKPGFLQF